MNTQLIFNLKRISTRLSAILLATISVILGIDHHHPKNKVQPLGEAIIASPGAQ